MHPIKAVIFDFDGTILDTETHEFRRWQALYRDHNRELPLQEWQRGIGTWDAFDPWAGLPDHVQQNRQAVYAQLLETIHADIQAADLRPGVRNVLDAIRPAGLRLALATSSDRAWVTRWLEQHDLLRHFETLATRDDVTRVKPDPELYTLAVHRLGLHPHECLAVEDSLNGATAAAAAGLHVVVVPNEVTRTQAFLPEWGRVEGYEGGLESLLATVRG
ncbi:phosphorylated carbohydrates phosphatase TM_1254 [Deinococcus caeni]|uniref:Phosphorylated carbohydrates phosphatase TM_1254 n=1 Tax=Deinococcus caeni TaxID=569127 RepID=A0ABP9UBW3_9DEIO